MTAFDGLKDWEPPPPRPWWLWTQDLITGVLVLVNAVLWPFIFWVAIP